uniref:rabenosyn-5-like n=1 Tax=Pristiophorus japonicus TaxID=55135 RepID=UPI00398E48A6
MYTENLLGLTSLPTLEKLEELQEKRRQREAEGFTEKQGRDPRPPPPVRVTIDCDSGWLASPSAAARGQAARLDDPLLEQMANIHSFLAQARGAGRESEARALADNLRQLEEELEARERRPVGAGGPAPSAPRPPVSGTPPRPPTSDPSVNGTAVPGDVGLNPFAEEEKEEEGGSGNPFEEGARGAPANPFEGGDEEEEAERPPGASSNPFEGGERAECVRSAPSNPFEEAGELGEIEEELLRQQIDNIKAYAFDAKRAGRMDEMASLMDNLGELRSVLEGQRSRRRAL